MLVSGREWMNQLKPKKNRNEKQLSLHDTEPAEGSCGYRMLCGDYPNLSGFCFVLFLPVPTPSFIVLYVHKNHKAYWELAKMGEEGDHIPITTLSPPE